MIVDLFESKESQARVKAEMTMLIHTPAWATLRKIMEQNLEKSKDKLINTDSTSDNYSQQQELRNDIRRWEYLISLPESLIDSFQDVQDNPMEDDVYARTKQELKGMSHGVG